LGNEVKQWSFPRKNLGEVLVDMRTPQGSQEALGGPYPSSSLHMQTDWGNSHKDTVQKLVNAFVKTLKWMSSHSANEIADKMPVDYSQGDKTLYRPRGTSVQRLALRTIMVG
jgi:NitT/TauT family transport system substrate-binding protein